MKVYSDNREDFNYSSIDDAIQSASDTYGCKPGHIITIWEADTVKKYAGDFLSYLPEELGERAYDEFGELIDEWPDTTPEQDSELANTVQSVINAWADKHGLQPTFYGVTNLKEIEICFTSNDGEWEYMEQQESKE